MSSDTVRQDTKERFWNDPNDPRHGSTNGYNNLGCRCMWCRHAWNMRQKAYMQAHPEQREKARKRERYRKARQIQQRIADAADTTPPVK
jgi:hypothetical protein